ncbi:MAG: Fe-S protein assembly co-chaperone HscB [Burkholderiales bacterium]|nr:Fe-S protein assembly co-chaperone HscB [Burkholderiales bacterium]
MINFQHNHFELFGLPQRFHLDLAQMEQAYRQIQSQVHPDRYVQAGDAERRASMQSATQVNEAYRTLKDPLTRARYLLALQQVDVESENNTAMPAEFLMQQMQWREAVEEAADQPEALAELELRLAGEMKDHYAELERSLDSDGDYALAAESVRKLMFLERLREEIGDALERSDA